MPVPGGTTRKFLNASCPQPQEDVALFVALELELGVDQERGLRAVLVHLDRVVDDEIDRLERIDALRIAAQRRDGVAHRGEIDDGGDAGEILQQYASGSERDLFFAAAAHVPFGERKDVVVLDERVVLVSQEVLQQDLETERQTTGVAAGRLVEGGEAVDDVLLAVDGKRRPAPEGILGCHWTCLSTRGFWPSEVTDGATGGTRTSTARLRTNLTRPAPAPALRPRTGLEGRKEDFNADDADLNSNPADELRQMGGYHRSVHLRRSAFICGNCSSPF